MDETLARGLPVVARPRFAPLVRFVDLLQIERTVIKLYGAQGDAATLSTHLCEATCALIAQELRLNPQAEFSNGVGFATMYPSRHQSDVTLDRWYGELSILHAGFAGQPAAPYAFHSSTKGTEVLPAWYLPLLEFERKAWQRCVLDDADAAAYLRARFVGE
ncbi:MAG: hypothetical protein EXS13_08295 [Planctomycetes bacterium]|nr:hypothetical protein [Planctomycetota bacterium]